MAGHIIAINCILGDCACGEVVVYSFRGPRARVFTSALIGECFSGWYTMSPVDIICSDFFINILRKQKIPLSQSADELYIFCILL